MKFLRYFPLILTTAALFALGSCKQDLGQDPPFDYPDEGSSGVQLPDPLYHLAFDDDLFLDGTLKGTMSTYTGTSPQFVDGKSGKAYQNIDGQALILRHDAASATALKSLGSYSVFMWIKFAGTNKNASCLFAIGNTTIEVANVAFFLNNGNATTPSEFFFKGFMQATGAAGKPDAWFDAGNDAKIQNMTGVWAHVGLTYNAENSTIALYHNGAEVCNRVLGGGTFGALSFDEVSGICLGAFPSQVGLGSGAGWTAEASFYTGVMEEFNLYDKVLTPGQVAALYEKTK